MMFHLDVRIVRLFILFVFISIIISGDSNLLYGQNQDSLLSILKVEKVDTNRMKILLAISESCEDADVMLYASRLKQICEQGLINKRQPRELYISYLGKAINCIGYYYSHADMPDKALENYKISLKIAEDLHDKKTAAYSLNNIAFIYNNKGDIATALDYYYRNLKIQEEIHDTSGIAYSLNNIGYVFLDQHENKSAMDYFARSLKMFEAIQFKSGIAMALSNIGTIYTAQNNSHKAQEYYLKSLKIYEQIANGYAIAKVQSCLAFESAKQGNLDEALTRFYKVIDWANKNQIKSMLSYAYSGIADVKYKKGDVDSAEYFATKALAYSKEVASLKDIQNSASKLKDIYEKKHQYKEALAMMELEVRMKDSIVNEVHRKAVMTGKLQYEYDKRALRLKVENDKKIVKKNIVIVAVLMLTIIVVVMAVFYTRHNKLKVSLERKELEQQQYRAQMTPHFIFNCLHSIQHFVVHNNVIAANKFLSEFASLMRKTMENNAEKSIVLQQEIDYLTAYLTLEKMRFENKFDFTISCGEDVNAYAIEVLPTIIQPFVENAILHGLCYLDGGGKLSITFEKQNNFLICKIDDNGIGVNASQLLKEKMGKMHVSQGIKLAKKRLALASSLNKTEYSLELIDKSNLDVNTSGTLVILKFPFVV